MGVAHNSDLSFHVLAQERIISARNLLIRYVSVFTVISLNRPSLSPSHFIFATYLFLPHSPFGIPRSAKREARSRKRGLERDHYPQKKEKRQQGRPSPSPLFSSSSRLFFFLSFFIQQPYPP